MILPRYRPRRSARGYGTITGPGSAVLEVSLYNDSSGPYMLVIRDIIGNTQGSGSNVLGAAIQGARGTKYGSGVNVVTGEVQPPGAIYTASGLTSFTPDYLFEPFQSPTIAWPHDFPFAILLPNWSYVVQVTPAGDTGLLLSFYWSFVHADDIDGSLEDYALKRAGA